MKPSLPQGIVLALTHGISCGFLLSGMVSHAAMPDLVVNEPRLASSIAIETRAFAASECAVVEGCVVSGARKLLLFDTGFGNIGDADLVIGSPASRPDLFEPSGCHNHFHLRGMATYEVLSSSGESVLRARKQGFCLRDHTQFDPAAGPARYDCDNQGLSVGWEDVYDKSLDCQWVDITGLPGGNYLLQVSVNPQRVFGESNYNNNIATAAFTIPGAPPPPTNGPPRTNIVCKIEAKGKGYILVPETGKPFYFDFKVHSWKGQTKGYFWAYDQESGVCIVGLRITKVEAIDDHTISIDLDVSFGKDQPGMINIIVRDGNKSSQCDSFKITLDDGATLEGELGPGCTCDWADIKVKVECKPKCQGGAYCKGHPWCDEHPYCKGKRFCKGHKDCKGKDRGDDDDDGHHEDDDDNGHHEDDDDEGDHKDDDDDGDRDDDDDGDRKCNGHPECKDKCKGKRFCKGHPSCNQHPFCEVPNCKGHKKCKKDNCNGHPECRKNYKHKKDCKAKYDSKKRCTCKRKS